MQESILQQSVDFIDVGDVVPDWMRERIIDYYNDESDEDDHHMIVQLLEHPPELIASHTLTIIILCVLFYSSYGQDELSTLLRQNDVTFLLDLYTRIMEKNLIDTIMTLADKAYKEAVSQLRLRCRLCGIPNARKSEQDIVCPECHSKERQHVKVHLRRARVEGLRADLTIDQWLQTLVRYDWKCAYCKGPYEVLEHITPLSYGIDGTTVHNCVPGCKSCNASRH